MQAARLYIERRDHGASHRLSSRIPYSWFPTAHENCDCDSRLCVCSLWIRPVGESGRRSGTGADARASVATENRKTPRGDARGSGTDKEKERGGTERAATSAACRRTAEALPQTRVEKPGAAASLARIVEQRRMDHRAELGRGRGDGRGAAARTHDLDARAR